MSNHNIYFSDPKDKFSIFSVLTSQNSEINWPHIENIGISCSALAERQRGIGGSDANIILSGDDEAIVQLWMEKRGQAEPQNLSDNIAVRLGSWTEEFNRQWYQKMTGYLVENAGASIISSDHGWRRCTLDGVVPLLNAVWEAKHTSAFVRPEEAIERYMPQLQHNMAVAGAPLAVLSVIFGNARWEIFEIASDWMYQQELLIAESRFWDCVRTGELPVAAPIPEPPKPVGVREVCLEGNNAWASAAADWAMHREAAQLHAAAAKDLKALVEDDVKRAFGHGIEARRSKAGAITIREMLG